MDIETISTQFWEVADNLYGNKTQRIPGYYPSDEDINAVEAALTFRFPSSVRYFILNALYGDSSFIPDFSNPQSIVWINREFHKNDEGCLPEFLIMWNDGHDGDCTCFDIRFPDANGEYPIVYWDYEAMTETDTPVPSAANFPEWLVKMTEYMRRYISTA